MALAAGARLGPYTILARIGGGGMGDVYRARDERLDRDVAIKTIASGLTSDPDRVARFTREAKAAAGLNHPNILAVHDVGVHDGEPFLVTELLDGRTLREVLDAGRPRPADVIDWTHQICDGLAAAHERGIVHRDLKPENLFLTVSGRVKILDFGLAKLFESTAPGSAASETETAARTAEGVLVGTVGYMAPELVAGQPWDHRADIFAMGCVLYELLSGRRAFSRSTPIETLNAILKEDPPSLESERDLPLGMARIVSRCLEKAPSARLQSARDLAFAVAQEGREPPGSMVSGRSKGRSPWKWAAGAAVVAIVVAVAVSSRLARAPDVATDEGPFRLVVLPFENLSRQPDDAWLAGAFSDTLTLNLRSAENLLLVDRARVLELARQGAPDGSEDTQRIVDALGVRYYVSGSYQRSGEAIRVVARLVDTQNNAIALQESITDRFESLLDLQDELGRRFATALHQSPAVGRGAGTKSISAYQAGAEANDFYLIGRYREAAERLESAVRLDDGYAEAWALLGKAYGRLSGASSLEAGTRADILDSALRAANKAVALNPALYEGQVALALVYRSSHRLADWQEAAQRAIGLNPRLAEAYALLGDVYGATPANGCDRPRDPELAERLYRKALELDPRWTTATANLIYHLSWRGRDSDALAMANRASESEAGNVGLMRARATALLFLQRVEEAEEQLRHIVSLGVKGIQDEWELAGVELMKGNREEAEKGFAAVILAGPTPLRDLDTARLYAIVGDLPSARRHVDAAVQADASCRAFVDSSPPFAVLRPDHRPPAR
jgi:serine/threonine protein kinase/tetratricopeptide (TPR) repeat protein